MDTVSILFICIANTCRSPMAEAIARAIGGGRVAAFSAGLSPTGMVADGSLATLRRLGYPAEGLSSKGIDDIPADQMDVIVSLIGADGLRYLPQGLTPRLEAWSIRDPYGDDEEVYLGVGRELERRITSLINELLDAELPTL
jgi:protein-tyrosine-phosphatase